MGFKVESQAGPHRTIRFTHNILLKYCIQPATAIRTVLSTDRTILPQIWSFSRRRGTILNRLDQTAEQGAQLTVIQIMRKMIRLFPIHCFVPGFIAFGPGMGLVDPDAPTAPPDLGNRQLPVVFYPAVALIVTTGVEQEKILALLEGHKPVPAAQVVFDTPFDTLLASFGNAPHASK
jgi:hypothetical protein